MNGYGHRQSFGTPQLSGFSGVIKRLIDKQPRGMGEATPEDWERLPVGGTPLPQQQPPSMDFSGASGNPFASKAQALGFTDFQKAGGQQQHIANALRQRG